MTRGPSITALAIGVVFLLAGCDTASSEPPTTAAAVTSIPPVTSTTTTSTTTTTTTTTTTLPPTFDVAVLVVGPDGIGLPDAIVAVGDEQATTPPDGLVNFTEMTPGPIEVTRFGWLPTTVNWEGSEGTVEIAMEPRLVRGLRVSSDVAADPEQFADLLDLAASSTVNALVFDTKDESSDVLYESESEFAADVGAVNPMYDPTELIAMAKDQGLYAMTRIVTFEDSRWAKVLPEHKLAGNWIDPTIVEAWEYPLQLAVEACQLGFDEIQFDYVRFPAGRTATFAQARKPLTEEERVAAITAFLTEARSRLHPLGCALSAAIFAIVLSSPDDEGIGQRPEDVSAIVDAVSPMIYPSHYSDGWLGFPSPNDHPGPVVADALDDGIPRTATGTQMRPWLQAFYYNSSQILAEISEAEDRGVGWILWNARGNYAQSALPPLEE
ncbi:MAG: hypothetical protein GY788_23890 [bacterium]|nr:hypothetical protein [bacterium]